MSAQCLMNNCRNSAPAGEAFCAQHRSDIKMPDARPQAPVSEDARKVEDFMVDAMREVFIAGADWQKDGRSGHFSDAVIAAMAPHLPVAARIIQQYGDQRAKAALEAAGATNTCEAPEVAAMRYIETLRSDWGTVTILPDNDEAETRAEQTAIDCCGEWTNWQDQRFYGESVLQCLAKAVGIRSRAIDPKTLEPGE